MFPITFQYSLFSKTDLYGPSAFPSKSAKVLPEKYYFYQQKFLYQPVDKNDNMIQELYLQGGYEGLLPVHALHWLVPHGLLQVPLCEELSVDQLCNLLSIH